MQEFRVPGISKPEDRAVLDSRHDEERREELRSLQLPPRMNQHLNERALELSHAIALEPIETAREISRRFGLRNDEMFQYLREQDSESRLAYCRLLIDPNRLERRENFVRGGASFEQADRAQAQIDRSDGRTGVRVDRAYRQLNHNLTNGESIQRELYRQIHAVSPDIDYFEFAEKIGSSSMSMASAMRRYDGTTYQVVSARSRARGEETRDHSRSVARYEAAQSQALTISAEAARMRHDPSSVSEQFRHSWAQAGMGHPDARPGFVAAYRAANGGSIPLPKSEPVSVDFPSIQQFHAAKKSLEAGITPTTDHIGFLSTAYFIAQNEDRSRVGTIHGERSVHLDNARAGLQLLAEEFKESNNRAALEALSKMVAWHSPVISPDDREALFNPDVDHLAGNGPVARLEIRREELRKHWETIAPPVSPTPEPSAAPAPPTVPAPAADPFADSVAQVTVWRESLDRHFHRYGNNGANAVEAAARKLVGKFTAERLHELELASAGDPQNEKLRSVLARARTMIDDRTAIG